MCFNRKLQKIIVLFIMPLCILCIAPTWSHSDTPDKHKASNKIKPAHAHNEHAKHIHTHWITPPADYIGKRGQSWSDAKAISHGKQLYQEHCAVCHGQDGHGTGPQAASLEHPPADLTRHFHPKPGKNDDYLFWRVSEGGLVEPFVNQQSAMPAFKKILSEKERWAVLAYIHKQFHKITNDPCILAEGVINGVDRQTKKLTITHAAIPTLGWPSMSMDFTIRQDVNIDHIVIGQKIHFCLMRVSPSEFQIATISNDADNQ